jgi:hypothetical protein
VPERQGLPRDGLTERQVAKTKRTRRQAKDVRKPPDRRTADNNRVDERGLEPRQAAFVSEYVKAYPRNATRAAMRSHGLVNPRSAGVRAATLMRVAAVRAAIDAAEFEIAREAKLEGRDVIARLLRSLDRAEAAGELAEVRKHLELLGRWRPLSLWRDRVAISGPDDGPVRVEHDLSKLSIEQLRQLEQLKAQEQALLAATGEPA